MKKSISPSHTHSAHIFLCSCIHLCTLLLSVTPLHLSSASRPSTASLGSSQYLLYYTSTMYKEEAPCPRKSTLQKANRKRWTSLYTKERNNRRNHDLVVTTTHALSSSVLNNTSEPSPCLQRRETNQTTLKRSRYLLQRL